MPVTRQGIEKILKFHKDPKNIKLIQLMNGKSACSPQVTLITYMNIPDGFVTIGDIAKKTGEDPAKVKRAFHVLIKCELMKKVSSTNRAQLYKLV